MVGKFTQLTIDKNLFVSTVILFLISSIGEFLIEFSGKHLLAIYTGTPNEAALNWFESFHQS